ncbi:putative necrosis-inducing factor-domain-containing protein [Lasiosphaeria ovina]|uniref:Necrosis-inducing factor-domain-containing protein n=1 Tax=Lasiosphaeria ovina TaxID=92902 RepID=A0AAE0NEV3_9PEZI|nr:putative necrosis-inducing factor-domain-containing protein [Lasiosphaeria ovina]
MSWPVGDWEYRKTRTLVAKSSPILVLARSNNATVDERAAQINDCDSSTFVNQGSGASPYISDCQQLAANIVGDGTWTIDTSNQHQLAQYGTCAFGAQASGCCWYAYIGNEDIRDLIYDSIRLFGTDGRVGSKGDMHCQGGGGVIQDMTVTWGISHT